MTSQARILANRRNAEKSTGPRTEAGKARTRMNAFKHGNRAKTVVPVLPNEDPRQFADRIERWIEDYRPRDAMERDLVDRAVRLSWVLDRAERAETAKLTRRVESAEELAAARRLDRAEELGKRLFSVESAGSSMWMRPRGGLAPSALVRRLEATAEGCRWLLARWAALDRALNRRAPWNYAQILRFVRLQGKEAVDAVDDHAVSAVLVAIDVLQPGMGKEFWEICRDHTTRGDHGFVRSQIWSPIAPRPSDDAHARCVLKGVIAAQVARLGDLLATLDAAASPSAADAESFQVGGDFDHLHRFQTARYRDFMRTIDTLVKLRKLKPAEPREDQPDPTGPEEQTLPLTGPEEPRETARNATNEPNESAPEITSGKEFAAIRPETPVDDRTQPATPSDEPPTGSDEPKASEHGDPDAPSSQEDPAQPREEVTREASPPLIETTEQAAVGRSRLGVAVEGPADGGAVEQASPGDPRPDMHPSPGHPIEDGRRDHVPSASGRIELVPSLDSQPPTPACSTIGEGVGRACADERGCRGCYDPDDLPCGSGGRHARDELIRPTDRPDPGELTLPNEQSP